jgi:hypothetical protein
LEAPDLDPYVARETLQEMGLEDYGADTFWSDYDDSFVGESADDFCRCPWSLVLAPFTSAPF